MLNIVKRRREKALLSLYVKSLLRVFSRGNLLLFLCGIPVLPLFSLLFYLLLDPDKDCHKTRSCPKLTGLFIIILFN